MEEECTIEECPPQKSERSRRLHALGVALSAVLLLSIAFVLSPSEEGIGTHQQLGLPTCGWILASDIPCPTCGMTTSWTHTVRGNFVAAFTTQPMGFMLALAAFFVALGGSITATTGFSFQPLLYRFPPSKIFIVVIILSLLAWGFKILLHKGML